MRRKLYLVVALVTVLSTLSFSTLSAQDEDAQVYVGHGIPGEALGLDQALPVDVLVDDALCLLEGFEFGDFAGPVPLAPDTYNIKILLADEENPCEGTAVIEADVPFAAGENATVIAHLTGDGSSGPEDLLGLGITASKFDNDVSAAAFGFTRLTVRHVAKAPAVDVKLFRGWRRGRMVAQVQDLTNPEQGGPINVRPGLYRAVIFAAGTSDVVKAQRIIPWPHKSLIFYAVGGLDTETFTLLFQIIDLDFVRPPRPWFPWEE